MSGKKKVSCARQIQEILQRNARTMSLDELVNLIPHSKHTIHNELLRLSQIGVLEHLEGQNYKFKEGSAMAIENEEPNEGNEKQPPASGSTGKKEEEGKPLEPRDQFSALVKSTGVSKDIVPSITNAYFAGDTSKLEWLRQVLVRNAAGFVNPNQARMIITSWAQICGLPYDPDEFPLEEPGQAKGAKKDAKGDERPISVQLEEEIGVRYKIEKDRDGDWVPVPGGVMTYELALRASQGQNYIKALARGKAPPEDEEPAEGTPSRPSARAVKPSMTFQDKFQDKMLDFMFDQKENKGDGDSAIVNELREQNRTLLQRLDTMEKRQQEERMERIEGMVAEIASRDPWDDPRGIAVMRQRLGIQDSTITDSSPVVQLIKDQSNKIEKISDRLVGIVERVALHPEEFRPENTRTPEEKETKAGALLNEAQHRDRARETRLRTFGV